MTFSLHDEQVAKARKQVDACFEPLAMLLHIGCLEVGSAAIAIQA